MKHFSELKQGDKIWGIYEAGTDGDWRKEELTVQAVHKEDHTYEFYVDGEYTHCVLVMKGIEPFGPKQYNSLMCLYTSEVQATEDYIEMLEKQINLVKETIIKLERKQRLMAKKLEKECIIRG